MFEKIKEFFKSPGIEIATNKSVVENLEVSVEPKSRKPKAKKVQPVAPELTSKEKATMAGEPYINILKIDVDPNNINNGAFELDWNDKFVINLIKAGYKLRPDDADADIVDRWFTQVCRNVALEVYEQQQADPDNRNQMRVIQTKDLGDGRSEVS